jgi:Holliday junction resolvase RusA-like endonuclease
MQTSVTVDQLRKLGARPKKRRRKTKAEHLAEYMATPPALVPSEMAITRELHPRAILLRLPLSPQINNYRAIFTPPKGRARFITSAQGRAYIQAVAAFWGEHFAGRLPRPLTGSLRLSVICHMARRGTSDLSNRWKALEDALTACGAWEDDGQIDDERMLRGAVVRPVGAMDVLIEPKPGERQGTLFDTEW